MSRKNEREELEDMALLALCVAVVLAVIVAVGYVLTSGNDTCKDRGGVMVRGVVGYQCAKATAS